MSRIVIGRKAWVVVCDGGKALFLRNDGDADLVNLTVADHMGQHVEATRDLGVDQPGRAFSSAGARRSSMGETDWHDQAETDFLKDIAAKVSELVEAHEITALILVAPPRALGVLRDALDGLPDGVIRAEVAKDMVKETVPEIEKHLAALE